MGVRAKGLVSAALAVGLAAPGAASAAAWSRSYLIEYYEPAHYYGRSDMGRDQPGTDCPDGVEADNDWVKLLTTPFRTREEAIAILDPERVEERTRGPGAYSVYYKRGPNGENIYENPTALPDPGMKEVQGKIAYGFNLDGDETTGFVGPKGERGVDNAFYKASGCARRFRGPEREVGVAKLSNDGMHDGVYSLLIVVSGEDSPEHDDNARLGLYLSADKMVKDANGAIAPDFSFRIDPSQTMQTVTDVRVRGGVVETKAPITLRTRDLFTPAFFPKQLDLEKAQLRFEMRADGTLFGYFGGYRDWMVHYRGSAGNGSHSSGAIHEVVGKTNLQAWWYALRRNADGLPDPKTGEMRGISTTYRIWAIPAFVVSPDGKQAVTQAVWFDAASATQVAGK